MNTVYVVLYCVDYEGDRLERIFANREDAFKYAAREQKKEKYSRYEVAEYKVHESLPARNDQLEDEP